MAKKKWIKKLGRAYGKNVQKKPYDFASVKQEVTDEFQPYFDEETAALKKENFTNVRDDLNTEASRFATDIGSARDRLLANINAAREQRDITVGQENQGYNQGVGSRNLTGSSPTAQRLRERLDRIQQARETNQERSFSEAQSDIDTRESRYNTDLATRRSRLTDKESAFKSQREQAFKTLVAGETYNRAFN